MTIQQIILSFWPGRVAGIEQANDIPDEDTADDKVQNSRSGYTNAADVAEAIRYRRDDTLMTAIAAGLTTTRLGNL